MQGQDRIGSPQEGAEHSGNRLYPVSKSSCICARVMNFLSFGVCEGLIRGRRLSDVESSYFDQELGVL